MASIKVHYMAILLLGLECFAQTTDDTTSENMEPLIYQDSENSEPSEIDVNEEPDYSILDKLTPDTNKYYLFTRSNPTDPQMLVLNDDDSVNSSNFNPSEQTVVVVHGYQGNKDSPMNPNVTAAFLENMSANVIVMDWSLVASSPYPTATIAVPTVGADLGKFLTFLNEDFGASYNQMHLVGFSLGAHVAGIAGDYLDSQVARITGLDPAGPLCGPLNPNRLTAANAVYVEAIHTNRKGFGTNSRSGDADFYPNGGISQPGCSTLSLCNHQRSWQLFSATIVLNHLVGRKCIGEVTATLDSCVGDTLPMGNTDLFKDGNGQYGLKTTGEYPYTQVN